MITCLLAGMDKSALRQLTKKRLRKLPRDQMKTLLSFIAA
jgi:hypothetical protein